MRLADPQGAKAILIGAARYDDPELHDIAQARANVEDLADILVDPGLGGFLPENVRTMVNPRHKDDAEVEIARWCRTATDTLVVYYAGHGLVDVDGELLLATSDTIKAEKEFRSLRADILRRAVRDSEAEVKIFIVDCCYSGRAFGTPMADETSGVLEQIEAKGTCGLASAPRHLAALFVEGERHTVFSGELITVLRDGLPGEGPVLPLFTIYRQLCRRMRERDHPEPKIMHSDSIGEFALVRNRAHRPTEKPVPRAKARPVRPKPRPPLRNGSGRLRLHTIAEADALVSGFPRGGTTNTALASAAKQSIWPVLARLRFVSELAHAGQTVSAVEALRKLRVAELAQALGAVKQLRYDLATGRAWESGDWDVGELIAGTEPVSDFEARQLWGTAMAMLLTAARLPTPLRIQAIRELADLGHRDEAAWIARGMLRDRWPDPDLISEVTAFLHEEEGGTPGRTGADR
ncbi:MULTISPECIES: caspase, EACC1-associated type [unclassified Amycolatopsis]|uniref:caspase family protein n=1 Tax=unclassified Amycolatopsis TaxID=2618356 RepID=UPI002875ED4A|nr:MULTISPECIES: caspase family protein [unclassified Amycolatopsis]MDS0140296.1 caspase family protein [Amycolatopsis sp. 505]MDS0149406.1 caspase family protein [Amycolatopsis sp. CM201R]